MSASAYQVDPRLKDLDALIIGSGPVGATYARKLVDNGFKVAIVEVGAQESPTMGEHKKNTMAFQLNIDSFVHVVKAGLSPLSVPVRDALFRTMNPISWTPDGKPLVRDGKNPEQNPHRNVDNASATRCVGGMSTHWTCAIPRQADIERSELLKNPNKLYDEAEELIGKTDGVFDNAIRHQLVQQTMQQAFPGRLFPPIPLAVKKTHPSAMYPRFVTWGSAATVLGGITTSHRFALFPQHCCLKLQWCHMDPNKERHIEITGALVKNLDTKTTFTITAKKYIICAGAVLTPQILVASGLSNPDDSDPDSSDPDASDPDDCGPMPALGRYVTDNTLTFCQVVLKRDLIENIEQNPLWPQWEHRIKRHRKRYPEDPLPFPFASLDPQLLSPLDIGADRPWHGQIHRDAFSYGEVSEQMDSRVVVDFRWFGMVEPRRENRVTFSKKIKDQYKMPQPTFHFQYSNKDIKNAHRMMLDMIEVAGAVGGYLPGSEPRYMPPGTALHMMGTYRAGKHKSYSVVDENSKVHDFDNLYLGGNGVLPKASACNPTLTSMCFAIQSANHIIGELEKQ